MRFCEMSAGEIAAGVREKKFSAAEVFEDCLNRTEEREGELSALITLTAEEGRVQAKRVDEAVSKGDATGLLAGVPVVLKDNICTRGVRTTAGSKILDGWLPPYDAAAWELLSAQGAVLLGKSNMDEFGTGTAGKSAFKQTANPHDISRTPGGSSAGSAAAVAAGYVPLALGSDTGGSVRLPAAYCGVCGLKPTYGAVSRRGLIGYGSSLEQIGPITRGMDDMALVMGILARHDPKDSTSMRPANGNAPDFAKRTGTLKGRRIAIVKEFAALAPDKPIADAMERTVRILEEAGAEVVEISLPTVTRYSAACYYTIMAAEAFTNFARFDGVRYGLTAEAAGLREMFEAVRSEGFCEAARHRILAGTYLARPEPFEEYYITAVKARALIAAEFNQAFESKKIDCALQPAAPSLPGKIAGALSAAEAGELDLYNLPANLCGLPGLVFRAGVSDGLPIGLQLVGPRWGDAELLDIGFELEAAGR